jgi:hypothetical protein
MRLLAFVGLCLALMVSGLWAQSEAEPLQLVKSFYAKNFDDEKLPMTQRLKTLYARATATSKRRNEPVAGLDFSWTLGAQDAEDGWEKTLRFAALKAAANQALVQVRFRLFAKDKEREVHYVLERERGRWVVADIRYLDDNKSLAKLFEKGAKGE